jgi:predicted RNA binding protein YcfA (HicA-like mRNA interferase family)
MGKHEKLLEKLTAKPATRDFKWDELVKLLNGLGFEQIKGSGSRRKFYHAETKTVISLHEPHPENVLKLYQVKIVVNKLKEMGIVAE